MKINKRSKEWRQAKKVAYEEGYKKDDEGYNNIVLDAYRIITSFDTIIPETKDSSLNALPIPLIDKDKTFLKNYKGTYTTEDIFTISNIHSRIFNKRTPITKENAKEIITRMIKELR